jgi:hypothetical protein
MLAGVLSVAITAATCAVITGGTGPATAAAECKDVFVLAVPGTWETTAKSDPNVVPGMLGNVVNPLKAAVERGVPIPGPTSAPVGVGSPATADMGQGAGGELAAGLTDLLPAGPPTASTTADSSPGDTDLWPDSSAADDTSTSPTADAGGDLWPDSNSGLSPAPSATTSVAVTPTPSTSVSESEGLGLSIGFEQTPYVAQVGGPIAQVAHGDPLTLGESRAQGTASLEKRLKQINDDCASSKVAIIGYSQGALIAGDVLSKIGNKKGAFPAKDILAAGLLSDPARTPTTADPDAETGTSSPPIQLPGAESFVGPNPGGQGVVGARPDGFGVLSDRVTSFCGTGDGVCALSTKSKAIAAVVPLLNLKKEDIGPYATQRALTLLTNVATADPADIMKAVRSVTTEVARVSLAASVNPTSLPMELARVVFSSSMLDDIGQVVRMPEYDAFLSLTKPDELATQAIEIASYALLGAHTAYSKTPVDQRGESATLWLAKWLLGRIQAEGY